jgi:hypothetical protein
MKRFLYALGGVVAFIALFCVWFSIASNYDYDALRGTYTYDNANVSSTLVLNADRTFSQQLTDGGKTVRASGTWRRIGEGGVALSADFLRLPGQQSSADTPGADPDSIAHPWFYGYFDKTLTVYPVLRLEGTASNLAMHRNLFR